jgi:hypothetical protein
MILRFPDATEAMARLAAGPLATILPGLQTNVAALVRGVGRTGAGRRRAGADADPHRRVDAGGAAAPQAVGLPQHPCRVLGQPRGHGKGGGRRSPTRVKATATLKAPVEAGHRNSGDAVSPNRNADRSELGALHAEQKPGRESDAETNLRWRRRLSLSYIAVGTARLAESSASESADRWVLPDQSN